MEPITILNRCHRFQGFIYQHAHFSADKKSIEAAVRPRKGSTAVCSRCHLPGALSSIPSGDFSSFCCMPCAVLIAAAAVPSRIETRRPPGNVISAASL